MKEERIKRWDSDFCWGKLKNSDGIYCEGSHGKCRILGLGDEYHFGYFELNFPLRQPRILGEKLDT